MSGTCFAQNCPYPLADRHPYVTHCSLGKAHSSVIIPNGISIGLAVLTVLWVPNAMLYNALSIGENPTLPLPSPWNIVTPPDEVKIVRVVREISSWTDGHTRRLVHHNTSQPLSREK